MLKWLDVLKFANNGNPEPDRRVEKTDEEWKAILTPLETSLLSTLSLLLLIIRSSRQP